MTKEKFPFNGIMKEQFSSYIGTLYKDDPVVVEQSENGDYRLIDSIGKIWYVSKDKVKKVS